MNERKFAIQRLTSIIPDLEKSGLRLDEAADWLRYLLIKRSALEAAKDLNALKEASDELKQTILQRTAKEEIEEYCEMEIDDAVDSITSHFTDIGNIGEEFDPGFNLPVLPQDVI